MVKQKIHARAKQTEELLRKLELAEGLAGVATAATPVGPSAAAAAATPSGHLTPAFTPAMRQSLREKLQVASGSTSGAWWAIRFWRHVHEED